uniref:Uncharacterized protein n=1 Tax=Oryza glumipatula TaxID=40148 RepID=A0A0E0BG85_9ORYZ
MEPPHLLRKVDPRTSDASNSKGNCQLGSQKSAERNGIPYLERKKKGCSSFNSLARFMRHKIVKYLLACMPRPSTFFLDVSEQVYIGLVWSGPSKCPMFAVYSNLPALITRRDLVENDRVLLNPAHSAQQEYERYVEILLSLFLS